MVSASQVLGFAQILPSLSYVGTNDGDRELESPDGL
jgi:hypothetical protein